MNNNDRNFHNKYLKNLLDEGSQITNDMKKTFGALSSEQLNWKPDESRWSIGQCIDHLITTNRKYFPVLEGIIIRNRKSSLRERMPFLPGIFGKMILHSVQPENPRKRKTFNVFLPSMSDINKRIVGDFIVHQKELITLISETDSVDHAKIVVTSPVSRLVTYTLKYCCLIIIAHEKRHLLQAKRVMDYDDFPGSE
jgi:hypothetical protein